MSGSCTISYRSSWRFRWDLGGASQRGRDSEGSPVKRLLHAEERWEFSPSHGPDKGPPQLRNKRTHWAPDSLLPWTTANLSRRKECLSLYSIQCCVGMCPMAYRVVRRLCRTSSPLPSFLRFQGPGSGCAANAFTHRVISPALKETFLKNPLSSSCHESSSCLEFHWKWRIHTP